MDENKFKIDMNNSMLEIQKILDNKKYLLNSEEYKDIRNIISNLVLIYFSKGQLNMIREVKEYSK